MIRYGYCASGLITGFVYIDTRAKSRWFILLCGRCSRRWPSENALKIYILYIYTMKWNKKTPSEEQRKHQKLKVNIYTHSWSGDAKRRMMKDIRKTNECSWRYVPVDGTIDKIHCHTPPHRGSCLACRRMWLCADTFHGSKHIKCICHAIQEFELVPMAGRKNETQQMCTKWCIYDGEIIHARCTCPDVPKCEMIEFCKQLGRHIFKQHIEWIDANVTVKVLKLIINFYEFSISLNWRVKDESSKQSHIETQKFKQYSSSYLTLLNIFSFHYSFS